jgi:4'-phosphopantetheinyl transferase
VVPIAFSVRFFDLDAVLVDDSLLSSDERERVGRKATPVLRQRQAASFQCLRLTLGEVLGTRPEALAFRVQDNGKPVLAEGELHFNVSHSAGVGLLAWGPRELGADVEALIARPSESLAEEILAITELEAWRALPTTLRQAALTRAWARKEATLKAIGSGLRIAPRTIDVGRFWHEPDAPTAPTTLRWTHEHEGRRWQGFEGFEGVPEGYRAAVCIEAESD